MALPMARWRGWKRRRGLGVSRLRHRWAAARRIFVPMHWTDVMAGGARANMLPGQGTDPVSGQPGFKNTPARVVPLAPEWRGFLLRRDGVAPEGLLWWSRSAVKGGWLHELAGEGAVPVEALLPAGERLEVADRCGACAASRCAAMMAAGGRAVHHPQRHAAAARMDCRATGRAGRRHRMAGRAPQHARTRSRADRVRVPWRGRKGHCRRNCTMGPQCGRHRQGHGRGHHCGSCRPALARMLARMMEAAE
jgi:assimilatory nitrate reductase catalytic subunit